MRNVSFLKKFALTEKQLDRFSNILDNAGQVMLGSIVFSQILLGFDKVNLFTILLGIVGVILCWTVSIAIARKG